MDQPQEARCYETVSDGAHVRVTIPGSTQSRSRKTEISLSTRNLAAMLACLLWMIASFGAVLVNKHILVDLHFPFPVAVTVPGMYATSVASFVLCTAFKLRSGRMSVRYYATVVMPIGFFLSLSYQTGNAGYLYLTVAFVQMLKAFIPVLTMFMLIAIKLERCSARLVAAVLLIACGVALASYGELNMHWLGLVIMFISILSESTRLVLMQVLLAGRSMHPLEAVMYVAPACSFWLTLQFIWLELPTLAKSANSANAAMRVGAEHPGWFALAAVVGVGVNCFSVLAIKLSSALTLKVVGTVKDALLVAVGVLVLGEAVSLLQVVGYSVSVVGFCWYNVLKLQPTGQTSWPVDLPLKQPAPLLSWSSNLLQRARVRFVMRASEVL